MSLCNKKVIQYFLIGNIFAPLTNECQAWPHKHETYKRVNSGKTTFRVLRVLTFQALGYETGQKSLTSPILKIDVKYI